MEEEKKIKLPQPLHVKKIHSKLDIFSEKNIIRQWPGFDIIDTLFYLYLFNKYKNNCLIKHKGITSDISLGLELQIQTRILQKQNYRDHLETVAKQLVDCIKRDIASIIIPLYLKTSKGGHANVLIYRKKDNVIEHFEPHGSRYLGSNDKFNKLIDKKLNLEGSIKSTSEITIYENEKVKKLTKDNLYSKVKDKIFSSEKTTFGSMNIDFSLVEGDLKIKSLVANNFKIGITAKGSINLDDNAMQLKGMIVPGYLVNSLFGLGKVPVLGSVIKGLLTGEDGGGIFSVRYEYVRSKDQEEGEFKTNAVSAFVPSSISSLFD